MAEVIADETAYTSPDTNTVHTANAAINDGDRLDITTFTTSGSTGLALSGIKLPYWMRKAVASATNLKRNPRKHRAYA